MQNLSQKYFIANLDQFCPTPPSLCYVMGPFTTTQHNCYMYRATLSCTPPVASPRRCLCLCPGLAAEPPDDCPNLMDSRGPGRPRRLRVGNPQVQQLRGRRLPPQRAGHAPVLGPGRARHLQAPAQPAAGPGGEAPAVDVPRDVRALHQRLRGLLPHCALWHAVLLHAEQI